MINRNYTVTKWSLTTPTHTHTYMHRHTPRLYFFLTDPLSLELRKKERDHLNTLPWTDL